MKRLLILILAAFVLFVTIKFATPERAVVPLSATACGRIKNTVIEVPSSYVPFWAEYVDDDPWGKGDFNTNRGCDSELRDLMVAVSWPDMNPVPRNLVWSQGTRFNGMLIVMQPANSEDEVGRYLDIKLGVRREHLRGTVHSIVDADLNYAVVGDSYFPKDWSIVFWGEGEDDDPVLFYCEWSPVLKRVFICEGVIHLDRGGVLVGVKFTPEKMGEWKRIVVEARRFVNTLKREE